MKRMLLVCFFAFVINLFPAELVLENSQPEEQSVVNIKYNGNIRGEQYLLSYHFKDNEKTPTAYSTMLSENTKLKIYPDDNFILLKVIDDEGNINDNGGEYWDIIVYKNSRAKENANLNKALSYLGSEGENYTRVPNYEKIKTSLEKELELYPENFRAKIAYETLKLDFKLVNYDQYESKIREILDTKINIDNDLNVSAAIKALYSINEIDKADRLKEQFVSNNPNSNLANDEKLNNLTKANSFDDFLDLLTEYLNNNYNDRDIATVYNSFVFAHSQSKKYMEQLDDNLSKLKYIPAYLYNEIALTFIEEDDLKKEYVDSTRVKKAETYLEKGIASIDKLDLFKPIDVTEPEWDIYKSKIESDLNLTKFKLNIAKQDSSKALQYVLTAIRKAPYQMNAMLYHDAAELANKYGSENEIKEIIEYSYNNNTVDSELEKFYLNLLQKRNDIGVEFLNKLVKESQKNKIKKLENSLTKKEKLSGFVQKLDDTFLDLESTKGKVRIISISSTWCDVCTNVYPVLNEVNNRLAKEKKAEVIGISVWEDDEPKSAVKDLINEYKIEYPYYIDNTDIIPRKFNVFGFPTIVIVDKDNYIRYTIRGFNSGEELSKLIYDFVEILE